MVGGRTWFLLITLLAVSISGCTASGTPFQEERPEWKAGYTWSIESGFKYEWNETEDGETDTSSWYDSDSEVVQILNTTLVHEGEPLYVGVSKDEDSSWGYPRFFRQRDLMPVYLDVDLDPSGVEIESYYNISELPTMLHFPLTSGKTWSDEVFEDDDEEIGVVYRSKVTGRETYDSALGPVDVIVIQSSYTLSDTQQALAAVREEMEEEGFTVHRLDGTYRGNGTMRYAPAYQHVIASWEEGHSTFHYDFEYEGERITGSESSVSNNWFHVTGARLESMAEVPLQQLGDYLSNLEIESPVGNTVEEVPTYSVSIDALNAEANVADGEPVQFKAVIDGEMPEGHELRWSATDQSGVNGGTGDGGTFEPVFTIPGVYDVVLEAVNGDNVVSASTTTAIGHYRTELDLTCGLVEVSGNGVPDDCASVGIWVRPGITSLDIKATTSSPADDANQGTIRLTDSRGQTITASSFGDPKHIVLDDELSSYGVAATEWELDWFQTLGVAESEVTMTIDLTYGGTGSGIATGAEVDPLKFWAFSARPTQ